MFEFRAQTNLRKQPRLVDLLLADKVERFITMKRFIHFTEKFRFIPSL